MNLRFAFRSMSGFRAASERASLLATTVTAE
jgi:hypothetical protein